LRRLTLVYNHCTAANNETNDLIYEGIATTFDTLITDKVIIPRNKRPDLRRDCDLSSSRACCPQALFSGNKRPDLRRDCDTFKITNFIFASGNKRPDLRRDCDVAIIITRIISHCRDLETNDLIYEGIATKALC